MKIRLIVTGFASHIAWAEGVQRALTKQKHQHQHHQQQPSGPQDQQQQPSGPQQQQQQQQQQHHQVELDIIPGDRWKFRMMASAAELESKIAWDDDMVIVDGMLDVTVLVALLKSNRAPPHNKCPTIYVYLHENQFTTPFTSQDRDCYKTTQQQGQQQQPTHWHYGMAQYRSLQVADGCIFNSHSHLQAFSIALPKVLKEQCPRDIVDWHLSRCAELLDTKCTVLPQGLALDELSSHLLLPQNNVLPPPPPPSSDATTTTTATILWNARLEEDKDPETFLAMLHKVQATSSIPFRLIVLGIDPTNDQRWKRRIEMEFASSLLYLGWCPDRVDYAKWLREASIVVSTARHETFGISIVESVSCGALPLLPNQLSYPELFPPSAVHDDHNHHNHNHSGHHNHNHVEDMEMGDLFLYSSFDDGVSKLIRLLDLVSTPPGNDDDDDDDDDGPQGDHRRRRRLHRHHQLEVAQRRAKSAVWHFRWAVMGPVYHQFFSNLGAGDTLPMAGAKAASMIQEKKQQQQQQQLSDHTPTHPIPTCNDDVTAATSATSAATTSTIVITKATDPRVQLYRPKSVRAHVEYHRQLNNWRKHGIEPALHGGRRNMTRMLEAISLWKEHNNQVEEEEQDGVNIHHYAGSAPQHKNIQVLSFLTTRELAETVLWKSNGETNVPHHQVPIYVVDRKELIDEIRGQKLNSGDAILAMIQFPIPCDLQALIQRPPILLLENVRNAENVGSILRTAFCLGITSVIASRTAWSALRDSRAARCSMGTMFYHRFYQAASLPDTVRQLQELGGIHVYGVEIGDDAKPVRPHTEVILEQEEEVGKTTTTTTPHHWAVVMGNEDVGLTDGVREVCDSLCFVPQAHGDSLNVGHAAAIALFELGRGAPTPEHDGRAACK